MPHRQGAAAGHEVGSHTLTHCRLPGASPATLAAEVGDSKRVLEDVLQAEVAGFCYPWGDFDAAAADAARAAGYDHACVTGDYLPGDRFTLPRSYVAPRDTAPHLVAKLARHRLRMRGRAGGCSLTARPTTAAAAGPRAARCPPSTASGPWPRSLVVGFHAASAPGRFATGWAGVPIFFVLSGYLITRLSLADEAGRGFSFRGFWIRRVTRIVPLYLLAVAAFMLLPFLGDGRRRLVDGRRRRCRTT